MTKPTELYREADQYAISKEQAVTEYKEQLKARIEKQRQGTYWLGETKEDALERVLELIESTE